MTEHNDFQSRLADLARNWVAGNGWKTLETIDAHTAGEPLRIIIAGYPEIPGTSILDRRRFLSDNLDQYRRILMWEPRGHTDMYGAVLVPSEHDEADFGVLFMHNEGYSSMCGHGIIAVTRVALEIGLVACVHPVTGLRIETPAGLVNSSFDANTGRTAFDNVPSFVVFLDQPVDVPTMGQVVCDLAYGGAYYVYVDAASIGLSLQLQNRHEIVSVGRRIKQAVARQFQITHPLHDELSFLYGTIFVGPANRRDAQFQNVCVFADGELDRSPTGTGVSGWAAIQVARGQLPLKQTIRIESIIGTTFEVQAECMTEFFETEAIVPRVTGTAHITGRNQFLVDPDDPLSDGFIIR